MSTRLESAVIPGRVSEESFHDYTKKQLACLNQTSSLPRNTKISSHSRNNPAIIDYEELHHFVNHVANDLRNVDHPLMTWPINNETEAQQCIEDLKKGSTNRQLEALNVEYQLATFDFSNINQMAFAASNKNGVARSIAIASHSTIIKPEDRKIFYFVSIDMLYTASRHRKKCIGATSLFPIALHVMTDISAFAKRFSKSKTPYRISPVLYADLKSKRGERACRSILHMIKYSVEQGRKRHQNFLCDKPILDMERLY